MDPVSIGTAVASKAAPVAGRELKRLWKKNELKTLLRAVVKGIKSDHRVPASHKKEVVRKVKGLRVDPTIGGCLKELLAGNVAVLPELEQRATQLLTFGPDVDDRAVVSAFVDAVQDRLIASKVDDRSAIGVVHREVVEGHSRIERLVERSIADTQARVRSEGGVGSADVLAGMSGVASARGAALSFMTSSRPLATQTPKFLAELSQLDQHLAEDIAVVLGRGASGLDAWLQSDAARLERTSVEAAVLVGRILSSEARFDAAESLFTGLALRDQVDPARQLVRAANSARAAGRTDEAEKLLDEAGDKGGTDHPAVVIARTRAETLAPEEVLSRLAAVSPATPSERSFLELTRAEAMLRLGDTVGADVAIRAAEEEDESDLGAQELRAVWRLVREEVAVAQGGRPNLAELRVANETFLNLRAVLEAVGRTDESGHLLSRAAEAKLIASDPDGAGATVELATDAERVGRARPVLARAALFAGRSDLAISIANDAPDDETRLLLAQVQIDSSESSVRNSAVEVLDQLMFSSDESVRRDAALARALACLSEPDPPEWSLRAEELLRAEHADSADIIRARAHLARREFDEAEAILRPKVNDNPKALDALVDAAAMRGEFGLALERAEVLKERAPGPESALTHARLLRANGRLPEALDELAAVARTQEPLLPQRRESAFRAAIGVAEDLRRYAEMAELAVAAIANSPEDTSLPWARALGLHYCSRHAEALATLDDAGLVAARIEEAELLARVIYRAEEPNQAVARLIDLSHRFGRPEGIEMLVIGASQRATALDERTVELVRETLDGFLTRFPDSTFLVVREVPETEQGVREFLDEIAPPKVRDREIEDGVRAGVTPTAMLAAAAGKSVSELWTLLDLLPVGYSDVELDELELQDARDALTRPAIFDPTSLAVLADLGVDVEAAVLNALPSSIIAQSTLVDADRATAPENDPRRSVAVVARDRGGQPRVVETDADEATRRARLHESQLRIAQSLTAEPDAVPGSNDELERALNDDEPPVDLALRTWVATLTTARRRRLPVLSDDRRVRGYVRAEGLPSFGTHTLLRALREIGDISDELYESARAQLLRRGAVGLLPDGDELIEVVRANSWQPTPAVMRVLQDEARWRNDPIAAWGAVVRLLHGVFRDGPGELRPWVARVLEIARLAQPGAPMAGHHVALLATAWGWTSSSPESEDAFLQAVVAACRRVPLPLRVPWPQDPAALALRRFRDAMADVVEPQRSLLVVREMSRLTVGDQLIVMGVDLYTIRFPRHGIGGA